MPNLWTMLLMINLILLSIIILTLNWNYSMNLLTKLIIKKTSW